MSKQKVRYSFISALSCMLFFVSYVAASNAERPHLFEEKKEVNMINPNSAFPVFIVKNLGSAKTFYENNFGFNVAFQNEWYLHLVSQSGIQVAFMLPNQPTQPDIFQKAYSGDGIIFSLEVNDADLAYSYAKNKSLDIVLELRSEEWGQRHFALKDPNGVYIDIVQAIEPSEEYQSGYDAK